MRNFSQKIENFTFLPEIACHLAHYEIFPKNVLEKFSQKLKIFLRSKNQSDIFVLSRPSRTMYTSATVVPVKGGQRKSMIAF